MTQLIKTICENCQEETNQKILFKKEIIQQKNKKKNLDEKEWYVISQCAGCDTHYFILRTFVPELDEEKKQHYWDESFPSNTSVYNFIQNDDEIELPVTILRLYNEVKEAFYSESPILAGIGLRTLVEAICIQQKIKGNNLKEKIINLQKDGLISLSELPLLDKLREIGNFSAHEIKAFSMDKLSYALEIVNHILRSIYVLPKINKKLKIISLKSIPLGNTKK
jgi:hypothetical protein